MPTIIIYKLFIKTYIQDLLNKLTLLPRRRGGDIINGLYNPMQSGVGPNGHVGSAKVVVDRSHHTHDV